MKFVYESKEAMLEAGDDIMAHDGTLPDDYVELRRLGGYPRQWDSWADSSRKRWLDNAYQADTPEVRASHKKWNKTMNEKKRKKKNMKEALEAIMDMPMKDGEVEEYQSWAAAQGVNVTVNEAFAIAALSKALEGNVDAMKFCRDTLGLNPAVKQEIKSEVTVSNQLDGILSQLNMENDTPVEEDGENDEE